MNKEAFCPFDWRIKTLTEVADKIEQRPITIENQFVKSMRGQVEFYEIQKVICCNNNKQQKPICKKT